ncbi:SseB family protein [Amaricoccus macauensis]|uniref:SseB family protein n=1 Tax=Amaricoccus macauensis TaxID=57001 RepID=UPI003C7C6E51
MTETAIDAAFNATQADPDDTGLYMRLLERIMDAELFLLLAEEPERDHIEPHLFEMDEGQFILAFDRGERLAEFLDEPSPYIALPGRRLVEMISTQQVGLALNLGVAPSEMLLPPEAVRWMAQLGEGDPELHEARITGIAMPRHLPSGLMASLDPKLAALSSVIDQAHLVEAEFSENDNALLLVLFGVPEGARKDVAAAIGEAVRFSGVEHARLDVTFLDNDAPSRAQIEAVSVRIELPDDRTNHHPQAPVEPGSDPDKPPRLR